MSLERARVNAEHASELALIANGLREERLNTRVEAVTADNQLAFWPVDLASGEPFDPDRHNAE